MISFTRNSAGPFLLQIHEQIRAEAAKVTVGWRGCLKWILLLSLSSDLLPLEPSLRRKRNSTLFDSCHQNLFPWYTQTRITVTRPEKMGPDHEGKMRKKSREEQKEF